MNFYFFAYKFCCVRNVLYICSVCWLCEQLAHVYNQL